MIKFNLMRPDDDLPDDAPEIQEEEQEEEALPDEPAEEGIDADEELDETILEELDDYKRKQPEIAEEEEDEEEEEVEERSGMSAGVITFAVAALLLIALFGAYYFELLPPAVSQPVDELKERIIMLVSGEKSPEPAIAEDRIFEEEASADKPAPPPVEKPLQQPKDDKVTDLPVEKPVETPAEPVTPVEETEVPVKKPAPQKDGVQLTDYEGLVSETARSIAFIDHHNAFIQLFPKGLFISTMSTSASDLLLEAKADDKAVFREFFDKVDNSALFNDFKYIPEEIPGSESHQAIFRGAYKIRANSSDRDLYNLSSERFIKALADFANKEKMTFTEKRSFEIDNDFDNVKTTMLQLGFYGNIEKILNFMSALRNLPATYSLEKIYLSRKPTDSFPVPIKLLLYISLHERGE